MKMMVRFPRKSDNLTSLPSRDCNAKSGAVSPTFTYLFKSVLVPPLFYLLTLGRRPKFKMFTQPRCNRPWHSRSRRGLGLYGLHPRNAEPPPTLLDSGPGLPLHTPFQPHPIPPSTRRNSHILGGCRGSSLGSTKPQHWADVAHCIVLSETV